MVNSFNCKSRNFITDIQLFISTDLDIPPLNDFLSPKIVYFLALWILFNNCKFDRIGTMAFVNRHASGVDHYIARK